MNIETVTYENGTTATGVAPLDKTSAQALDYLNRNDLQGSPLREGGQ